MESLMAMEDNPVLISAAKNYTSSSETNSKMFYQESKTVMTLTPQFKTALEILLLPSMQNTQSCTLSNANKQVPQQSSH
jgi:hypothetical protein|tara:strand:- start:192 stop:428 length:237 start_codon:yes stop_codon:yes gene_type:complete